jgi:ParB family chromosome partitioning protein
MFTHLSPDDLHLHASQPRKNFDDDQLAELAESIKRVGVLTPLLVEKDEETGKWMLIAGERRLRASKIAGLESVPVWVAPKMSDHRVLMLIENVQRVDLSPVEEAHAYSGLVEKLDYTHEDVARATGKSRTHVTATMGLLRLPEAVLRRVEAGVITLGHARVLVTLETGQATHLASRIVAEGLSVASTREIVALSELPSASSPRRKSATPGPKIEAAVSTVAYELSELLATRVVPHGKAAKGSLTIHFMGREDLQRIADILGVKTEL